MFEFRRDDTQNRLTFHISDNYGGQVELDGGQALAIANWLSLQRDELLRMVHPKSLEEAEQEIEEINELQEDY